MRWGNRAAFARAFCSQRPHEIVCIQPAQALLHRRRTCREVVGHRHGDGRFEARIVRGAEQVEKRVAAQREADRRPAQAREHLGHPGQGALDVIRASGVIRSGCEVRLPAARAKVERHGLNSQRRERPARGHHVTRTATPLQPVKQKADPGGVLRCRPHIEIEEVAIGRVDARALEARLGPGSDRARDQGLHVRVS